jgi:hypothetical protein
MQDYEVDTTGAHPPPTQDEFSVIRKLSREYGELIIQEIELKRQLPPEPVASKRPPFWKRFVCRVLKK